MSDEIESTTTREHGHERVPGYDVARAIAVCGMVLINFGVYLLGPPRGTPGEVVLRWLAHVPGGRASSLFVTLAGVGIARMAYGDASLARKTLLKRAAVLVLLVPLARDVTHFFVHHQVHQFQSGVPQQVTHALLQQADDIGHW